MKKTLKYQKISGLIVFCKKCRSDVYGNSKKAKNCNHPLECQSYKAIVRVPNSGYERKTKILSARNYEDALVEFVEFQKQVKNPVLFQQTNKKIQSQFLKDTMAMYIDYLQDVNTPQHLKKHLSKVYINRVITHLQCFVNFLTKSGINLNNYKLSMINDSVVGMYYSFLQKKNISNYTFNDKIKTLRTFYIYLIEKEDYVLKNVWKKVNLKSEKPTDISISSDDFYDLLLVISPDEAITKIGKTTRNMYRPWLKDLIRLKAYTGRRNAELFAMKWDMIHFEEGKPVYVESPNIKVNKQQNNFDEKDFQFAYIPVGEELLELLIDLNLTENMESSDYLIAPEIKQRESLEKQTSKSFTFFFKKLNRNYKRKLKHLRQTYITKEDLFINGRFSMQHSKHQTTKKHYSDRHVVAKWMGENGFRIFDKKIKKCTPDAHSSQKERLHIAVKS